MKLSTLLAILTITFLPNELVARDYWEAATGGHKGARVYPLVDDQTGHFFCFALACKPDQPLAFSFFFVGGDLPEAEMPVELLVDGELVSVLSMRNTGNPDYLEAETPYDPRLHTALLEGLISGSRAAILIDPGGFAIDHQLSLNGSSKHIKKALDLCPVASKQAPIEVVADPEQTIWQDAKQTCEQVGGTLHKEQGFATEVDFSGDGNLDRVFSFAGLYCEGATTLFCGGAGAGCPILAYVAQEGGFQKVLDQTAFDWADEHSFGKHFLTLAMGGNLCGKPSTERCYIRLEWDGKKLLQP